MEKRFEPYLTKVLDQAPRLLGQMDRNPLSNTYGCFDRQYWHYSVSDFPCSRHQEAVLTLALLYQIKHKKNPYYKNPKMKEWIRAALKFWMKMQSKDGSMSEWYPNEHSFGPTAFGVYAVSDTLLLMGNEIGDRDEIIIHLKRSADWLMKRSELRAQNQECGSIAGIYNVYLLTKDEKYKKIVQEKIKIMKSLQHKDGWFDEYSGADIGYLSLALFYLTDLYKKSKMAIVKKIIDKSVDFMSYFVHPDMTFGGVYGSRNTEYIFPFCFEFFAKGNASMIAKHSRESISNNVCVSPFSLDDRYLAYITYVYLKSYLESNTLRTISIPPYKKKLVKEFVDAGLLVYSKNGTYIIINYRKGGSFFAFVKGKSYIDSGIEVESNKTFTSGVLSNHNRQFDGKTLEVSGNLSVLKNRTMNPKRNVMLRLFQMSLGKSGRIGTFMKNAFRNKMITNVYDSDFRFTRKITLGNKINIYDEVKGNDTIKKVFVGTKSSYIYVPSSRYFQLNDLESSHTEVQESKINKNEFSLTRTIG